MCLTAVVWDPHYLRGWKGLLSLGDKLKPLGLIVHLKHLDPIGLMLNEAANGKSEARVRSG